jgi:2,3-bisphosphoglycerate-independent phosphoglycerate mutase
MPQRRTVASLRKARAMTVPKPVVLCILDGWGLRDDPVANAPALANVPNFNGIWADCPHSTLTTFGPDVGLPTGQMGNSEVGHTNIGAGRVVAMDLGAIDLAIEEGTFFRNPALLRFIERMKTSGGTAHLIGVLSDGGVHGHILHLLAAIRALTGAGVPVIVHAITDGRDVPPSSAARFMMQFLAGLPAGAHVGTVTGRYWAMDRDNRWERVARAVAAIIHADGAMAPDATEAVAAAYARGETDEFIAPTVVADYGGARDGDGVFFLNFRADRAREILSALGAPGFDAFDPGPRPHWAVMLGMVDYSTDHNAFMTTAYPKQDIHNTLGEWVATLGKTQLRLAETEKYPHVTFFLNGGKELPVAGEDRYMAPSPKVATYDLQPEMSASEVSDHLVAAIHDRYDLIVVNFANPDMVGHTGDLKAAIAACEAVDKALGLALAALVTVGGAMIVTADHGNCETMVDPVTGAPHTAHTTNPVPVILVGGPDGATLRSGGRLADLAPTLLDLMALPLPPEMTGKSLIRR